MVTTEQATPIATPREWPAYARVQVFGLALAGVTLLVVSGIVLVVEEGAAGEILGFFVPVAVVLLLAAWLAWRYGTWARI